GGRAADCRRVRRRGAVDRLCRFAGGRRRVAGGPPVPRPGLVCQCPARGDLPGLMGGDPPADPRPAWGPVRQGMTADLITMMVRRPPDPARAGAARAASVALFDIGPTVTDRLPESVLPLHAIWPNMDIHPFWTGKGDIHPFCTINYRKLAKLSSEG